MDNKKAIDTTGFEMDISARENDGYDTLLRSIDTSCTNMTKSGEVVFTTDAKDLFDAFLGEIPEDARQHYTCSCCRQFVDRFGGLVTIDPMTGKQIPIMWNPDTVPEFFMPAVTKLFNRVSNARVNGIAHTKSSELGTAQTGPWHHLHAKTPFKMHAYKNDDINVKIAAEKEDHALLAKAIHTYDDTTVKSALHMFKTGVLSSSDSHIDKVVWFMNCKNKMAAMENKRQRDNMLWYLTATAPTGLCHIANSVVGALLDDLTDGMSVESAERRFNDKVDPRFYQRPQAAPTAGAVAVAEKKVEELGIAKSLMRRYARFEEIETIWTPSTDPEPEKPAGVFSGIVTKDAKRNPTPVTVGNTINITWVRFRKTILPDARKIRARIASSRVCCAAFTTTVDPSAPPIFKWDNEEKRNPVSWYTYPNGMSVYAWNIEDPRILVDVKGIAAVPHMWGDHENTYSSLTKGMVFILDGVKDVSGNTGLGLFPIMLKGELHDIRSVIEAYSNNNTLEGVSEASACGLYITTESTVTGAIFEVETDLGKAYYNIDRWE